MAESTANGTATRVVLLARTGKAADHLADALRRAGAELLLAVDPAQTDEATLRALGPQAVLVALEPSIEPALDRLDGLLSDPALTVIFDEADVAAHRAGWDAARWVRHLAAKLRHDSNVLPPGAENDNEDLQPTPGAVPRPAAAYTDADFDAFAREAEAVADSVPVDASPGEPPAALPRAAMLELDASLLDAIPSAPEPPAPAPAAPAPAPVNFGELSLVDDTPALESVDLESVELDSVVLDAVSLDTVSLDTDATETFSIEAMELEVVALDSAADGSDLAPMRFDDDAFFLEELSADGPAAGKDAGIASFTVDGGFGDFDPVRASPEPSAREPERVLSFEELIAASLPREDAPAVPAPAAGPPPLPPAASASVVEAKPAFSFGDLSLAPVEDAPAAVEKPRAAPAAHDLSVIESRISALSLVDLDDGTTANTDAASPFALPGSGAVVLIEAGLGGPDPTRQLLAALPAEFPATVLVRLHLQGGRYDRLVAQMSRAAALPVALAEAGSPASAGTIYFLPEGVGIAVTGGRLGFIADAMPAAGLFAALPAGQSALVFLSGADPQLVDPALASAATGTLVVAQMPEDCYDGTSCAALRARGAASGLPADLAGRLAARWPS
jgi:chemosensory pili system protein ChpB (putative protein-glutamate methylesterase)